MFEEYDERLVPQGKVGEIFLYHVKAGDNVYRIARMYNTKIEWIACMNDLNAQMLIFPNQKLYIPVIRESRPPQPPHHHSYDMYF